METMETADTSMGTKPKATKPVKAAKDKPQAEALSIRAVADILGVHPITVRRWIKARYILAYRVGPFVVRIPRSELARLRRHHVNETPLLVPSAHPVPMPLRATGTKQTDHRNPNRWKPKQA